MYFVSASGRFFKRLGSGPAGWWQVTIILAPLLLLAGLGIHGLQASRQAALDEARLQAAHRLDQSLPLIHTLWDGIRRAPPVLRLYPSPPVPTAPNAAADLYAKALEQPAPSPAHAVDDLTRLESEYRDALAPSGVPLLPLAQWTRLRLETKPAEISILAAALRATALHTHPSVLTPNLLMSAEALLRERRVDPAPLAAWRQEWSEEEQARSVWRQHEAETATMGSSLWLMDGKGQAWWVQRNGRDDSTRQFLSRDALRASMQSMARQVQPSLSNYAAVAFTLDGQPLLEPRGDALASSEMDGLVIRVVLALPEQLYAQQRQQTRWLAALLASALAAALAGFWALRRALVRERQLGQLKSDFVSSVSHELRAPVAAMRLMAENLESGMVPTEKRQREYHHHIAEECRRLSALIDNVLDFARIEQDRKTYAFEETDVAALVRDALALMDPRAVQRRQELASELRPVEPPPVCDGLAVRQAVINLLDNAIKFSPEGTRIRVRLGMHDTGGWQIAVHDEGPGIPAAEHARVFERFYRLGCELRRETQGAGIGLSIVKHVAEAHGGRVKLESQPGAGAAFTLVLPLRPPGADEAL